MRVFKFLTVICMMFALQPSLPASALNEAYPNMAIAKIFDDADMDYRVVWNGWYDVASSGMTLDLVDHNNQDGVLYGYYRVFVWHPSSSLSGLCMQYYSKYWERRESLMGRPYNELVDGHADRDCPEWYGLGSGRGNLSAYGFRGFGLSESNKIRFDVGGGGRVFVVFVNEWQRF